MAVTHTHFTFRVNKRKPRTCRGSSWMILKSLEGKCSRTPQTLLSISQGTKITQGADRVSAPARHRAATGRDLSQRGCGRVVT